MQTRDKSVSQRACTQKFDHVSKIQYFTGNIVCCCFNYNILCLILFGAQLLLSVNKTSSPQIQLKRSGPSWREAPRATMVCNLFLSSFFYPLSISEVIETPELSELMFHVHTYTHPRNHILLLVTSRIFLQHLLRSLQVREKIHHLPPGFA